VDQLRGELMSTASVSEVEVRVSTRLRSVIADVLGLDVDQVGASAAAGQLDGWDSFGHLQVVLALEAEFGVQFDPQKIPELTTVAKLQRYLESKGAKLG
jgi:acyl carrier protein